MNENIAVKIDHVEKSFRLPTENTNSLKRTLVNYFKGIKGYRNQEVLRDISFEVEKGDFFGIVGRNGSGKSTLLKIISQIYYPEKGNVEVNGKLVSFIELGVGFNPELTDSEFEAKYKLVIQEALKSYPEVKLRDIFKKLKIQYGKEFGSYSDFLKFSKKHKLYDEKARKKLK